MRLLLSVAVMFAAPAGALAQGTACDEEAARAPYKAGIEHMRAARYAEAVGELERANRLCPDPRPIFKQCQCREHLLASADGCAAAARCYDRYFAACKGRACPDEGAARQRKARLLGELCGRVRVTSEPPGAALSLDGAPSGEIPREMLLQAGGHTFAASWRGQDPVQAATKIRGGANPEVALRRPPPPPPPPKLPLAGWITLGAGVATAATGAIFTAKAYGAADDCDAATTRRAQERATESMDEDTTIAAVLYGIGGAAALTGAVLLVLDASGGEDSDVALSPAPGGFVMTF